MGHFLKSLLRLLALLPMAWLPSALDAAPVLDDGPFYMLDFHNFRATDEAKAKALVERFRSAAAWAIPLEGAQAAAELACKVEFVPPGQGAAFTAFTFKRKELRVALAESHKEFLSDISSQRSLMAVLLLARCGLEAERLERGFPDWLAAGLARKVVSDSWMSLLPGSGGFPAAYGLASRGYFPALKSILDAPLDPSYGECAKIYAEYCHVLVLVCARAGMAKDGVFAKMLRESFSETPKPGFEAFVSIAGPYLASRRLSSETPQESSPVSPAAPAAALDAKPAPPASDIPGKDRPQPKAKAAKPWSSQEISDWFAADMRRSLLNGFSPASVRYFETLFKEASRVAYKDEGGVERVCEIDELPAKWKAIKDPAVVVSEMRYRLSALSNFAPQALQEPLLEFQAALGVLLAGKGQPGGEALAAAKRRFFERIDWCVAVDAVVKRAEAKAFRPALRYGGLMAAIKACDASEEAPYAKEAAFLDAFLKGRP